MQLSRDDNTYTFTNCEQTDRTGPSQSQCNNAYSGTNLEGQVSVSRGIQEWTVPRDGDYFIEAVGARGGNGGFGGGLGAKVSGEFNFLQNDVIRILVGQMGQDSGCNSGGGGSFAFTDSEQTLLIAAGGGGGNSQNGNNGTAEINGTCGISTSLYQLTAKYSY